jgi:hypothetical protein
MLFSFPRLFGGAVAVQSSASFRCSACGASGNSAPTGGSFAGDGNAFLQMDKLSVSESSADEGNADYRMFVIIFSTFIDIVTCFQEVLSTSRLMHHLLPSTQALQMVLPLSVVRGEW